jgi:hypothetical protein
VAARGGEPAWSVSLQGSVARGAIDGLGPMLGGQLRVQGPIAPAGPVMFEWSALASAHGGRAAGTGSFSEEEVGLQLGAGPALYLGRLKGWLAVELGGLAVRQAGVPGQSERLGVVPIGQARLGVDLRLVGAFGVSLGGWAGAALMPIDGRGSQPRPRAGVDLGVFWRP